MRLLKKTVIFSLLLTLCNTGAYAASDIQVKIDNTVAMMEQKFPLAADIYKAMVTQSVNSDTAMKAYASYGLSEEQINRLIAAAKETADNPDIQQTMASIFTLEELQEMHRFYTGPLSGSIADKLEAFERAVMDIMKKSDPGALLDAVKGTE